MYGNSGFGGISSPVMGPSVGPSYSGAKTVSVYSGCLHHTLLHFHPSFFLTVTEGSNTKHSAHMVRADGAERYPHLLFAAFHVHISHRRRAREP